MTSLVNGLSSMRSAVLIDGHQEAHESMAAAYALLTHRLGFKDDAIFMCGDALGDTNQMEPTHRNIFDAIDFASSLNPDLLFCYVCAPSMIDCDGRYRLCLPEDKNPVHLLDIIYALGKSQARHKVIIVDSLLDTTGLSTQMIAKAHNLIKAKIQEQSIANLIYTDQFLQYDAEGRMGHLIDALDKSLNYAPVNENLELTLYHWLLNANERVQRTPGANVNVSGAPLQYEPKDHIIGNEQALKEGETYPVCRNEKVGEAIEEIKLQEEDQERLKELIQMVKNRPNLAWEYQSTKAQPNGPGLIQFLVEKLDEIKAVPLILEPGKVVWSVQQDFEMAYQHFTGIGEERSLARAYDLFKKAESRGDWRAAAIIITEFGDLLTGKDHLKNLMDENLALAEEHDPYACWALGLVHDQFRKGNDHLRWFRQGFDDGCAEAGYQLAMCNLTFLPSGGFSLSDWHQKNIIKIAGMGHVRATWEMHYQNLLKTSLEPKTFTKLQELYGEGHARSGFLLACIYLDRKIKETLAHQLLEDLASCGHGFAELEQLFQKVLAQASEERSKADLQKLNGYARTMGRL